VGDELTRPVRDARRFPSTELYRGLHARRDSSGVVYLSCKGHFPSPRAYPNVRFATFASLYTGPHLSLSLHSLEVGDHRSAPFVQLGALHLTQGTLHRIAHPTPPPSAVPKLGMGGGTQGVLGPRCHHRVAACAHRLALHVDVFEGLERDCSLRGGELHEAEALGLACDAVSDHLLSVTQRALSVTQRALSLTQRALTVTQRALSVTQ
jgi:hypothetical protein